MNTSPGTLMVMKVANALENLLEHFVFVGGAVTDLLIENNMDGNRPTKDVDIITEISSYTD
jgi:predicted nucleotidyltransferase